MTPAITISIAIVAFGLRLAPRLIWPDMQGTDAFYHRAYIRLIKETGERLPRRNPRIIGPGEHSYPSLFHYLLSKAPAPLVWFVDAFGGLFCDAFAAGVIALLLIQEHQSIALFAAALYLLAPGLTLVHIGPRAFTLSPRCWAQVLFFLACLALLLGHEGGGVAYYLLSAVLLAVMLLASLFALQALVFSFPLIALGLGDPAPLAVMAAGFAIAFVLWGSDFVRRLKGQWMHLTWYRRHNMQMLAHRNNWRRIGRLLAQGKLVALARALVWDNPVTSGMIRHFPLFLALWFYSWLDTPSGWQYGLFVLSAVSLAPWLLTSFGMFRILGEAERYLEFAFPASWLLLWSVAPAHFVETMVIGFALLFVAVYLVNLVLLRMARDYLSAHDEADIAAVLRARGKERAAADVMLCLSDSASYYFLAECDVVLHKYNGDLSAEPEMEEFLQGFFHQYPYVDPARWHAIAQEAGVSLVLLNKPSAAKLKEHSGLTYELDDMPVLHENKTYCLYDYTGGYG